MSEKPKKQPVRIGNGSKKSRRKTSKPVSKSNTYKITIINRDDFDIDYVLHWINDNCAGKSWHKVFKKHTVFFFIELEDAFNFKLHYERAPY